MLMRFILFLCLICVQPIENSYESLKNIHDAEYYSRFSMWPSMHNAAAARIWRYRRDTPEQKEVKPSTEIGQSEGGGVVQKQDSVVTKPPTAVPAESATNTSTKIDVVKPNKPVNGTESVSGNVTDSASVVSSTPQSVSKDTVAAKIGGDTEKPPAKDIDFNNPGVLKRGFIVFGGFALLAVAYFVFYKRKNKASNLNNSHTGLNDTNQFRYGVLQSDDRRDNMELSRVPLTMESDDEEEEDLEIFDLEQKKKSLSYVNLPLNDEDVVLSPSEDRNDRDNLLLDIESANSDTLINWSSNSNNKSIL